MLHPVTWYAVTHVSKDHSTFNFTVSQSKESVYRDDKEPTILQNASKYSPIKQCEIPKDLPFRQHTGDKLKTCQTIRSLGQDLNPEHPKYETRALTTLTVPSHLFK